MSTTKSKVSVNFTEGLSIPMLLSIIFTVLKLTNQIDWAWHWVLAPLWIGAAAAVVIFILVLVIVGFFAASR